MYGTSCASFPAWPMFSVMVYVKYLIPSYYLSPYNLVWCILDETVFPSILGLVERNLANKFSTGKSGLISQGFFLRNT